MEIVSSLNWVDILAGIILIRAIYVGIRRGFVVEILKLIGVLCAIFIALHYYTGVSAFLQSKVHLPKAPSDFFSYGFLWAIVILIFKFIREGLTILFKIEAHSVFDKWGGLVLSLVRGLLLCSLTILLLRLSTIEYLTKNLERSLSAGRLVNLAPQFYESCYDNLVSKFFPSEELNKFVFPLADFKEKPTQHKK